MNCPCGEKAVSFGPFGNACPRCVVGLNKNTERARLERRLEFHKMTGGVGHLLPRGFKFEHLPVPAPREPTRDTSRCSCGQPASRWYEGGASCWFCVPRRTTQEDKVVVYMSEVWQANLGRVEAIARRQHRRRSVLNIAKQTKDQYPVALRDWELWQVAKVQEDGRLKDVLAKSRKGLTATEAIKARTAVAVAAMSGTRARANHLAALAETDIVAACRLAGVPCPTTSVPVDPAPYFTGPMDWDAAFYKALQIVDEDKRVDVDACYQRGLRVFCGGSVYQRGRKPILVAP